MGRWLIYRAAGDFGGSAVTLVEGLPIGASPRDYLGQLATLLDDVAEYPILYVQVLQDNFSEGLLEVFDFTGSRVSVQKVKLA